MFEIWDQWSSWKQHVESLKNLLAVSGWSENNPWGCVCHSNKLCSAGGKTATEGTHARRSPGSHLIAPSHRKLLKTILFRTFFPLGKCQQNECIFVPVSTVLWKKVCGEMHRTIKKNSQRWESCALPKAAENPCCSHHIRCWHCKFQPVWLQNGAPNLPVPQCHVYLYWGMLQSGFYGLTVEANPWRPWPGAVWLFLMYTWLSGLTSVLAATYRTARNDTSLVHCSGFSEM